MGSMARRRMSGEGSVWKRTRKRPDGREYVRWVAQVSFGSRDDRRIVRRIFTTKAEARDGLAEMLAGRNLSRQPLGAYLRSWLDETAGPSIAPNTRRGYEAVIAEFAPIAAIPIADLTPEDVESCLNRMTARRHGQEEAHDASPKTRRNALAMLRRALSIAERRGHISRNVARMVEAPRVPRNPPEALTPERAREILAAVEGDRYEAAFALALCGLRLSEVLGLAWEDVDETAGSARVRYQIVGSGKTARRAQLKTLASEAPVPLPPFVMTRLRTHHDAQRLERIAAGRPTEDGLVFVTQRGYAVSGSWLTKHFQALLLAAKLPKMRIHDLRHGAASLLAAAGAHPRVAQALLRHASSRTTMDVYTHVTSAQEREAADLLERMVAG
jgi:integrase